MDSIISTGGHLETNETEPSIKLQLKGGFSLRHKNRNNRQ
jgi:hypothetical protein